MRKTIQEIVEETYQYYTEDPKRRAINADGKCVYAEANSPNMCAVGRCMLPEVTKIIAEHPDRFISPDACAVAGEFFVAVGTLGAGNDLDSLLREEYRGHPTAFWKALQGWHDSEDAWQNTTASIERNKTLLQRALNFAPIN